MLLLAFLEFVAGVNRVTRLCGDMRHFPALIDMLKDQVQELGSRDVKFWMRRRTSRRRACTSYSKEIEHAIPIEMRLKEDNGAIIVFGDVKLDNNMSDAGCEVCSDGGMPMQALGTLRHLRMWRDGLCANPFTYPPECSKFSGERVGQRVKAFLVR